MSDSKWDNIGCLGAIIAVCITVVLVVAIVRLTS